MSGHQGILSQPVGRAEAASAVTSLRTSLVYPVADVAAICVILALAMRLPVSGPNLVILAIYAILLGFLVRSLLNASEVQIHEHGVALTTLLWRLRGLPPIWVDRAEDLEVESCSLFWHSSLTIAGIHLELPGPGPLRAVRQALETNGIEVVETASKGLRLLSPLAFACIFAAAGLSIVVFGENGVTLCAAGWALALIVAVTHSVLVDRDWRKQLARA